MNDAKLVSKFSNIFINLLYSIMTNDINKVGCYLSKELYDKYSDIIENNKNNNELHMYDELNASDIKIVSQEEIEDKLVVKVKVNAKHMDYFIDNNTKQYKRGVNDRRLEICYHLTFEKMINAKQIPMLFKCPNCGGNLDINFKGTCNYCKKLIDLSEYDFIMTECDL